jgi:hypothetical protein
MTSFDPPSRRKSVLMQVWIAREAADPRNHEGRPRLRAQQAATDSAGRTRRRPFQHRDAGQDRARAEPPSSPAGTTHPDETILFAAHWDAYGSARLIPRAGLSDRAQTMTDSASPASRIGARWRGHLGSAHARFAAWTAEERPSDQKRSGPIDCSRRKDGRRSDARHFADGRALATLFWSSRTKRPEDDLRGRRRGGPHRRRTPSRSAASLRRPFRLKARRPTLLLMAIGGGGICHRRRAAGDGWRTIRRTAITNLATREVRPGICAARRRTSTCSIGLGDLGNFGDGPGGDSPGVQGDP